VRHEADGGRSNILAKEAKVSLRFEKNLRKERQKTHLTSVRVQNTTDDRVDDELSDLHQHHTLLEVLRLLHFGEEREDGHVSSVGEDGVGETADDFGEGRVGVEGDLWKCGRC
jgi:hypothetical protein